MEIKINIPSYYKEKLYKEKFPKVKRINLDVTPISTIKNLKNNLRDIRRKYKKVLIVGNGGSITTSLAFIGTLKFKKRRKAEIINTNEPSFIKDIKENFSIDNTIVIVISKSGKTSTVIENYYTFKEYDKIIITSKNSLLENIAKEDKKVKYIFEHPEVGGRFTGPTIVSYVPLYLLGFNINIINKGFREAYVKYKRINNDNKALSFAKKLYFLEKKGFNELYFSLYSKYLTSFTNLIIQLFHESICKDGKGQTVYCAEGPESQHHTNQRVFGGRKNIIVGFIQLKDSGNLVIESGRNSIYEEVKDINLLNLNDALKYELEGTYRNCVNKDIPAVKITLDNLNELDLGHFVGFLHYLVIYSSQLRGVNPFDQPAVEDSKKITLNLLKERENLNGE